MSNKKGIVFLIPTTMGEVENILHILPNSIKITIENTQHYIVENEKTARKFIKKIHPQKIQNELQINILNKFTDQKELNSFLNPCENGFDIGILSEAGCPGIADPGADIVKIAHQKNIQVIPLVGPSSILMAMMASGMNGQNFAFNGYLPIDSNERKNKIKELERISQKNKQSQIFIETPYRNQKLLNDLIKNCNPKTKLCLAVDITLPTEFIKTKRVIDWKIEFLDIHKKPMIFILHA